MPEKIIVTDRAGFIGSHLVDKLISLGNKVIIIDNFGRKYQTLNQQPNSED